MKRDKRAGTSKRISKEVTAMDLLLEVRKTNSEIQKTNARMDQYMKKTDAALQKTNSTLDKHIQQTDATFKELKQTTTKLDQRVTTITAHMFVLEDRINECATRKEMKQMENTLLLAIDKLAKKVDIVYDEQRAQHRNYQRLDSKVETHDRDIRRIKVQVGVK